MEFLRSFLRRHLAGKPVVASPNVGCFLRPENNGKINITWDKKLTITAMFTLYRIAFASPRKQYLIGLMFTNKNGCGGAISVTERSYAAPIFKVESHISDRCSHYTGWLFGAAWNAIRGYRVNLALPWWLGDKVEQSFLINKGQILMARLEPRLKDLKFDILKLILGDASVLRGTPLKFMYLNIWM